MDVIIDKSSSYEPFEGSVLLYGATGFERFQKAHVAVIGIGGVGSWAAEALARNAIGTLTLIDPDRVALTNRNRQIQALTSSMDALKVEVLGARILDINPTCQIIKRPEKVTVDNVSSFFETPFDYVIDAIDDVFAKTAVIVYCTQHKIPIVTIGGAGGQKDPTFIDVCDLAKTEQEPLLAKVRKRLRQKHQFPRGTKSFGIDAVYSKEPLTYPEEQGVNLHFGTSVVVTASFGMTAASVVLKHLANGTHDEADQAQLPNV